MQYFISDYGKQWVLSFCCLAFESHIHLHKPSTLAKCVAAT